MPEISVDLARALREDLANDSIMVLQEWVEEVLAFWSEKHGAAALGSWSRAELRRRLHEEFLISDLNAAGSGCLPPGVDDIDAMHKQTLQGTFVLQIDEVVNVAEPESSRYDGEGGNRFLKLRLTDGKQSVTGSEFRRVPALAYDTPAGTKVAVTNVRVLRGLLDLGPECIHVLGGRVEHLERLRAFRWERIRKLHRRKPPPDAPPDPEPDFFAPDAGSAAPGPAPAPAPPPAAPAPAPAAPAPAPHVPAAPAPPPHAPGPFAPTAPTTARAAPAPAPSPPSAAAAARPAPPAAVPPSSPSRTAPARPPPRPPPPQAPERASPPVGPAPVALAVPAAQATERAAGRMAGPPAAAAVEVVDLESDSPLEPPPAAPARAPAHPPVRSEPAPAGPPSQPPSAYPSASAAAAILAGTIPPPNGQPFSLLSDVQSAPAGTTLRVKARLYTLVKEQCAPRELVIVVRLDEGACMVHARVSEAILEGLMGVSAATYRSLLATKAVPATARRAKECLHAALDGLQRMGELPMAIRAGGEAALPELLAADREWLPPAAEAGGGPQEPLPLHPDSD